MNPALFFLHVFLAIMMPVLLASVIRRSKALMQGRPGPPFFQFWYDLRKRFRKGEVVSTSASWIFRTNPLIGLSVAIVSALILPWTGAEPLGTGSGAADLILVIYLLGLARLFAVLAALDTGSSFGGLGASRECTVAVLVEPSILLSLAAVCLTTGTTDLSMALASPMRVSVAVLAGLALLLASLAELSRMPVDDPTTHLELTMVHEATILENGGRNLAYVELTVALRTALLLGLVARLLARAVPPALPLPLLVPVLLLVLGILLGVFEGIAVKLNWRKVPGFVAYATGMSFMAAFVAVVGV